MRKLARLVTMAGVVAMAACSAPETGSEIYDNDTETEREGMETDDPGNTKTEQDGTMEEKYDGGSDEDPIRDSLKEK